MCRGDGTLLLSSTRETRNAYLDALEHELMSAGDILEGRRIASISVGGGIATVVSPDRLARILLKFKRTYNVVPRAELSVTAAPQTLVSPCLSGLNICNVNRIRIVAYTPVDKLLEVINASHKLEDIENGTAMLVKFGYSNIDALLMYGIPGQTLTTVKNTIIAFTSVKGFRHITLKRYELSEQSGVTLEESDAQYSMAVEMLAERSVNQYTADSFASNGCKSNFVLHELMGMERVGFGLGAKSYIDNMIYQNTTDFECYLRDSGDFIKLITGVTEMSELDKKKRFVALRLQLVEGFDENEYFNIFGCTPDGAISDAIEALVTAGLISRINGIVRPTAKGLMQSEEVVTTVIGG